MDITTLGIGVDSRQVDTGRQALDELTRSAGKAENAIRGAGDGAQQGGDNIAKGVMKGTLAAQAIEKAVELAIEAVKQLYALMSQAGEYADLADMTGASAVNIAKLQTAADIAGVSIQGMAGYMNQMTRILASTDEEGDKAARALGKIGLSFEDLKALDPAERIAAVAQAMSGYADGVEKTQIMQALFGRGAGEVIKVMKVLGDETKFQTNLTKEMIERTDAMSDAHAEMSSKARQAIQAIATGVIPGMEAFKGAVIETALEIFGLSEKTDILGANRGVEEFVINAGHFLTTITIPFELLGRLIEATISAIKALAQASAAVLRLDWSGVENAVAGHLDRIKELGERKFLGEKFQENLDKQNAEAALAMFAAGEEQKKIAAGETDAQIKERERREKELARIAKAAAADRKRDAEAERKFMMELGRKAAMDAGDALEDANKVYRERVAEQAELDAKNLENATKDVAKIHEKAAAIEEEVAGHGKLKSAIEEVTIARLEDDLAKFEGSDQAKQVLENEIAARKRLAEAIRSKEVTDAAAESAKGAQKEFEKAWEQVGQSLTDQLMKGSLDAADLIKNLFKTMVLRPTIMGAAQGFGQSFMGGAVGGAAGGGAAGGGGGGMGGIGSMAGQMAGTAMFGGVASAAATTYTGAMAAGLPVANAIGMGAGAGLAAIPVVGWVALAAIAAYALYKKFGKGGGPKIEGTAGYDASALIGAQGNVMDQNAMTAVKDLNANYRRMASALGSTSANAQFGVGYSMDPKGDAPSMVHIRTQFGEYVNKEAGRTAEELAKALAEGSAVIMVEALRNSGLEPQMLAYFDKITVGMTAEAKVAAFEQVAAVGAYWRQLQTFGGVLKQFNNITLEASVHLAELSGGVSNLGANISTYTQNFLKPEEQAALQYQQIAAQLNQAGSGWTGWSEAILRTYNKETFRKLVEGLDLASEGDRMRYAALMQVAGAFAELNPEIDKTTDALKKQEAAQERYETALDTLRNAYERQRDVLTTTRDAMHDATRSFLDFNKSLRLDQTLSNLTPGHRQWELQAQYEGARNTAQAGGYKAEDNARMQEAARALLQGSREFYGSGADYDIIFKKITDEMTAAADVTRTREFVAESQLQALEKQVGHLVSIDNTLISVHQALQEFIQARTEMYALGFPHAEGLSRVPFNNYPALLHKEEMVLPQQESNFIRGLPDFSGELRALRQEVAALRKENRQDAGNTIGATFTAAQQAAQVQSEATIRAARQRTYQSRSRPVLA